MALAMQVLVAYSSRPFAGSVLREALWRGQDGGVGWRLAVLTDFESDV